MELKGDIQFFKELLYVFGAFDASIDVVDDVLVIWYLDNDLNKKVVRISNKLNYETIEEIVYGKRPN